MEETLGQKLRAAREAKELSLDQISKELHIRAPYLRALEDDSLDSIPTKVQARGFLRSYSTFLGLSPKDLPEDLWPSNDNVPAIDKIKQLNIQQSESLNPKSASILFEEIGNTLKERRDVLGLSMEDIDAHTHIPSHYVRFMENGKFDIFPSPTQARGMLANYLSFLDIPADEIMLKYADALQMELSARQAINRSNRASEQKPRTYKKSSWPRMPKWVRTYLSPDLILVSTLGVLVISLTIWGIGRVTRTQSELVPPPTAPSLVEALLPTSTEMPTPTTTLFFSSDSGLVDVDNTAQEDTPIPTVQIAESSSIQLLIIARQRAYLRVVVDGNVAFDGRILPGESLNFSGQSSIELLTGNAAGIQIIYNDQDLGTLGIFGEIVKMIYTREGAIRPTEVPTATLSAQELSTPSATPTQQEGPDLPPSESTPIP